ncbi:hypothetical protein BM477_00660 [Boudabousia marimammalium]|uniref:Uncharacterized protein n=1 Tax=Boudabousia marimammalium TaxID=156892 RepID=A0A1Q5PSG1_9ACTO|nr:hypothetical protein BM477_00660 [Boudabousia marimammalium]
MVDDVVASAILSSFCALVQQPTGLSAVGYDFLPQIAQKHHFSSLNPYLNKTFLQKSSVGYDFLPGIALNLDFFGVYSYPNSR